MSYINVEHRTLQRKDQW